MQNFTDLKSFKNLGSTVEKKITGVSEQINLNQNQTNQKTNFLPTPIGTTVRPVLLGGIL